MARQKTTRPAGVRSEFILLPSRPRMIVIYTIMFTLALVVGLLIRAAFGGWSFMRDLLDGWYLNALLVVGGAVVFAIIDYARWTIRVQNGEKLEGPTGGMGERAVLSVKEIDWQRTGRSLNSRLKIGNAIYTSDRRRILISPWFYPPARYQEFLAEIGFSRRLKDNG